MNELIKNIGLGLFVNGSFALMNGNIAIPTFYNNNWCHWFNGFMYLY